MVIRTLGGAESFKVESFVIRTFVAGSSWGFLDKLLWGRGWKP